VGCQQIASILPVSRRSLLLKLEQRIGYEFKDRSAAVGVDARLGAEHRLASNEAARFLGDAILGAVVCELLFHQYPEFLEES